MLDITKRIKFIEFLLLENTVESLTYAALEGRLTIEYLCYKRFKLSYSYISAEDLKNWQPKHVVKQISEEINENINKGFTLSISTESLSGKLPANKEEFESVNYTPIGNQSAINLNKLHSFWHGLSNVALHIPVPNIDSGDIRIYGDREIIKKKIENLLVYLLTLKEGNLLMGGSLGKEFSFNCFACETLIKKPFKLLTAPIIANCINPKCNESYLIEPKKNSEHEITRCIIKFLCLGCKKDLEIPSNVFKDLKFQQQLNIFCGECQTSQTVIMRPLVKNNF
ncbi:hypothetical protein [Psychromonas arctica]|uniref:hypothetical protein n=1 Tax=Psychromonas arctica TaxID=168275 RepID=UPI00040CFEE4|nr:hypothetical protein [Psychromonas arctica]